MAQDSSSSAGGSAKLVLYWAIVAIPLSWGVYKTIVKSQPLFTGATTAAVAAPAASPAAATPASLATPAPADSPAAPRT